MSKFVETEYGSGKGILKFPDHYVAMAVMVDDQGVTPNEQGRKIVPKGTIVGGNNGSVIDNIDKPVIDKVVITDNEGVITVSATGAEGVLMNDVDVTYGPKEGAMVIHGFIKVDALPYTNLDKVLAAVRSLDAFSMIKFIK